MDPVVAPRRRRRGFTMIEVCVAVGVMTVAMVMFASVIASSSRLSAEKRDSSVAAHAARSKLEELRGEPFAKLWVRYNAIRIDDPDGPGTAPGASFVVPGLTPALDDADGIVGEIVLPHVGEQLREDAVDSALGLPRDLNGDTLIDETDHKDDYKILPVLVRVHWRSDVGPRTLEMYSMLTEFKE